MEVSVLHIDDCPNWVETGSRLRTALDGLGASEIPVDFTVLRTHEEAGAVPFAGSPTIVVDGTDLFPSDGQTTDLACRVYQTGGRLAGMPSVDDIAKALRHRIGSIDADPGSAARR